MATPSAPSLTFDHGSASGEQHTEVASLSVTSGSLPFVIEEKPKPHRGRAFAIGAAVALRVRCDRHRRRCRDPLEYESRAPCDGPRSRRVTTSAGPEAGCRSRRTIARSGWDELKEPEGQSAS